MFFGFTKIQCNAYYYSNGDPDAHVTRQPPNNRSNDDSHDHHEASGDFLTI